MASRNLGVRQRTNQQWLSDLRGLNGLPAQESAYLDLGRYALTCAHNRLRAKAPGFSALAELSDETLRDYAMDFAQATLEKIAAHNNAILNQFRNESPFTSWVAKITNHLVLSELRKMQYRLELGLVSVDDDQEHNDNDPMDNAWWAATVNRGRDSTSDPETAMEKGELYETLVRCLELLPERVRAAFLAKEVDGRTGQYIAERLQTTPNAVYILLSDARKRLSNCLQGSGYR